MKLSLQKMLLCAFVALTAVPLIIGFTLLINYSDRQFHLQIEDKFAAISGIAKKRVIGVVDRVKDNTNLVASRTQMRLSLRNWNYSKRPADLERVQRIIGDAHHNLDLIEGISIFDPAGNLIVSSSDLGDVAPHVIDIQRARYIYLEAIGKVPYINSVAPLILEGERIGFVDIRFSAKFLDDLVQDRTGLGDTGEWLFATKDAQGNALFATPLKYDLDAAFQRVVSQENLQVPITQALLGHERIMRNAPDYRGVIVLASTRYIPELDWGIVVKMDEAETHKIVDEVQFYVVWGAVVLTLMALFIGGLVARKILAPVDELRQNMARVAAGDFDVGPVQHGWRELADFSHGFNKMAKAVKSMNSDLHEEVEERSKALDFANRQLETASIRDGLTGVYNRRYFQQRLKQEFERSRRQDTPLTLVCIDVDDLSKLNRAHSRAFGDNVLVSIASTLQGLLPDYDILARTGGDEFSVLLQAEEAEALSSVEKLRREVSELMHYEGETGVLVTCSFGVALLNENVSSVEDLVRRADIAMHWAKEEGRDRYRVFENTPSKHLYN